MGLVMTKLLATPGLALRYSNCETSASPGTASAVSSSTRWDSPARSVTARSTITRPVTSKHRALAGVARSEEHTSELQSLMRISYAVFCLKKKKHNKEYTPHNANTQKHTYKKNQSTSKNQ